VSHALGLAIRNVLFFATLPFPLALGAGSSDCKPRAWRLDKHTAMSSAAGVVHFIHKLTHESTGFKGNYSSVYP
jgi:hypothetical protein